MFRKFCLLVSVAVAVSICVPFQAGAKVKEHSKTAAVLAGLKSVKLVAGVTGDARQGLKMTGVHADKLHSALISTARNKLKLVDISVESAQPGDTALVMSVVSEMSTGTIKVVVSVQELVKLVRPPNTEMRLTTWSIAMHPDTNELKGIREAVAELLDEFVADYLSENDKKQG